MTVLQHWATPLLQAAPPRATGSGAAATSEERATTGKRRADARKNILRGLWE